MKNLILLVMLILPATGIKAADQLQQIENQAFTTGEKLTFKLYYTSAVTGNVTAGEMVSEINKRKYIVRGDTTYYIKVVGGTKGAFRWFFDVHDVYQTFMDDKLLIPRYFQKRVKEGDYKASRDVRFFHENKKAFYINNKNKDSDTVSIDYNVQDIVSAIYYARTFNSDTLKLNDKIEIPFFMDDTVYQTQLKYVGKTQIKTSLGTINCLKFNPSVLTGAVFKDDDKLMVYISDDKNHLPVLAESEVMVGKVRIELTDYSGLKNPFSSRKK